MTFFALSESVPTTTLSGVIKSLIAAPSLRNSGLDATSKSIFTPLAASSAFIASLTLFAVPTGTVDFVTIIVYLLIFCPKVLATASTYFKSAEPSSSGGVPTAEKTTSTSSSTVRKSVVKFSRPAATLRRTISSNPGS